MKMLLSPCAYSELPEKWRYAFRKFRGSFRVKISTAIKETTLRLSLRGRSLLERGKSLQEIKSL